MRPTRRLLVTKERRNLQVLLNESHRLLLHRLRKKKKKSMSTLLSLKYEIDTNDFQLLMAFNLFTS